MFGNNWEKYEFLCHLVQCKRTEISQMTIEKIDILKPGVPPREQNDC